MTAKEKHIIEEGSHRHVSYWDNRGEHCSEPNCEVNTPTDRDKFIEGKVKEFANGELEAGNSNAVLIHKPSVLAYFASAIREAWEAGEKNGNKTDGEQGAMALLYGMRVKKNPLVPEDEIWIGTGKDGLKIKIQPPS